MFETPENAPEEAEDATGIATGEGEAAKQKICVVTVGRAHDRRRVVDRMHGFVDEMGELVELGGCRGRVVECLSIPGLQMRETLRQAQNRLRDTRSLWLGWIQSGARRYFIKADGDGLSQIHRGLRIGGWNCEQGMTEREVLTGEPSLLGTKDERDAAAALSLIRDKLCGIGQCNDRLFGLAAGEAGGSEDKDAADERFAQSFGYASRFEQRFRSNSGFGFAPVRFIRCDHSEVREAEVGHGARHSSDVERIARRDEDDVEIVEAGALWLRILRQGLIVFGAAGW